MSRNYLFLYLDTGAGHISSARVVKAALEEQYPDSQVILTNGFSNKQVIAKTLLEKSYQASCNAIPGSYSLIYDYVNFNFVQKIAFNFIYLKTVRHLRKKIRTHQITDIISFHFILTPCAIKAVKMLKKNIPITSIVTDPFTAHTSWFYDKTVKYIVFSREIKDFAVNMRHVPEANVHIMPFLMNKKFLLPLEKTTIQDLREKHHLPLDKKLVLLAGGGEGLPGALYIVQECLKHRSEFGLIVVCGRDIVTKTTLDMLAKANKKLDLHVFGFVDFMDELVKLCDCAVIKAGPATLLEVLKCKKPVIICKYIHGQELGNVRFAVQNKVGWFIRKPKPIYKKIKELFTNETYYANVIRQLSELDINTDITKVAEFLHNQKSI
ncbi:MAG: MGDG synthase family glycosyltransferase [Treponemataceae bacterium]